MVKKNSRRDTGLRQTFSSFYPAPFQRAGSGQKKLQARYWIATPYGCLCDRGNANVVKKNSRRDTGLRPLCENPCVRRRQCPVKKNSRRDTGLRPVSVSSASVSNLMSKKTPGEILDCDRLNLTRGHRLKNKRVKKNSRRDTGLRPNHVGPVPRGKCARQVKKNSRRDTGLRR